jgi:hypothetical protein
VPLKASLGVPVGLSVASEEQGRHVRLR